MDNSCDAQAIAGKSGKYTPETGVIGSYDDPKAVMTAQKEPTEQYMAGRPWIKVEMTQLAKYRPLSGSHLAEECKGARRQVLAEECKVSGVIILLKSTKKPSIEGKGSGEHARAGLSGEEDEVLVVVKP